jgi:uncharacterized protein (TIGR02594 family)
VSLLIPATPELIKPSPLLIAVRDLENGVEEIRGSMHHPRIVTALQFVRYAVAPKDETAWCAAIASLWLAEAGCVDGPRTASARGFLTYGTHVRRHDAKPGDAGVFWRGRKDDGVTGHVGIIADVLSNPVQLTVVGGNQREMGADRVSIKELLVGRLLDIRRFEWRGT